MQGKGLIKFFLVLLILVGIYQVFLMFPTQKAEQEADAYAEQFAANYKGEDVYLAKKTARSNYIDSISGEQILSIPLLGSYTYSGLKSQQLSLGLDLKGGMSSVLQVNLRDLLTRLSRSSRDVNFNLALENAEKRLASSQNDYITLFRQEYDKIDSPDKKKLATIFKRDAALNDELTIDMSDVDVVRVLRQQADETVQRTFERLKQRIDKLGVAQPNVTLDGARDLILVEIPGIDSPERAREFLKASAALEFWDTYRSSDPTVVGKLLQADRVLKNLEAGNEAEEVAAIEYDTIWTQPMDSLGNIIEGAERTFTLQEKAADPFADQGPLFKMFTLNTGAGDLAYSNVVFGFTDKNKRSAVSKMLARPEVASLFPSDSKWLWSRKPFKTEIDEYKDKYMLYLIKKTGSSDKAPIEGDVITNAQSSSDPVEGMVVNLQMNNIGAKKWAEMSDRAHKAGRREVAICLDNEVISAPSVNEAITQGSTRISGNFNVQEAQDFAGLLEVGKLPAKIDIIQEDTVGPSLGAKNINSSIKALIIGFLLVLLFMIFYYGGAGIVAIIALLLNLFFIFGALASLGTVLTLPGIAGIVLTIGMAVDANVIIFERIREELRAGKSNLAAISDGFRHSYSAIIDANVTTILVAAVLFYFGLGPIKGFATVLIAGVLMSVFTAVLVGRLIIDWWTKGDRTMSFWTPPSKNMFANLNIDWMGKRKIAYVLSSVVLILGLASMFFINKFDLGVDFRGGYSYNVQFDDANAVEAQQLREGLASADFFGAEPVVKAVDTENTYNIVTSYLINDPADDAAERAMETLHKGIQAITGSSVTLKQFKDSDAPGGIHVTSSSKVGPTIADDIKKSSFYAGLFALLLIFLYIFLRFNRWQFSLGAVAALFHDSLILLGVFSLLWKFLPFSLEINQAFIAALLTVIGYSINDTVVVFDRIREYLGIYSQKSTDEILNLAINSTFSRTIITSLTTMVMLIPLFIFGGGSIKGFAFAILIGIVVGTYSSIFVATPIVRDLSKDLRARKSGGDKAGRKSFSKAAAAAK